MKMKMKIRALYLTGTALLIGAAGVGDSVTLDTVGSWTGAAILTVLLAAGGIVCWGYGRGLEIEQFEKAQMRRYCSKLRSQSGAEEENDKHSAKEKSAMVRIEIKKVTNGQVMLVIEAKKEAPDEVLTCAARGFVGVARHLLGPMATNPQFAEEISRGIKEMLLDTEDLKVTRGVEGKEAKFMAALYGMNAGEQK